MPLAAVHSPVAARYPPAGSRPRGSRWPARAGTAARSDPSGAAPDRCPQHAGSPTRWTARPSRRASSVRRGCGGVPIADSLSPPGRRGGDARACRRAAGRAPLARVVFARSQPAVPGQRHRICFLKRNRCRGRVSPGPISSSPPSGRPAATKARFDSHLDLERRLPLGGRPPERRTRLRRRAASAKHGGWSVARRWGCEVGSRRTWRSLTPNCMTTSILVHEPTPAHGCPDRQVCRRRRTPSVNQPMTPPASPWSGWTIVSASLAKRFCGASTCTTAWPTSASPFGHGFGVKD